LLDRQQLEDEIDQLDTWLATQQFHPAYDIILRIRKKLLAALPYSDQLRSYIKDAMAVNQVLTDQSPDALDALAYCAQASLGAASPPRKALGTAMMTLGISLLVIGLITAACAFPLIGFCLLFSGTACFAAGISFFRSGLQQGMAMELDNLAISSKITMGNYHYLK
jgi:hypothetical protein